MVKKREKEGILYRTEKFEIFPNEEEIVLLWKTSQNLSSVFNEALQERQERHETFFKPIYERISQAKKEAKESGCGELWEKETARMPALTLVKQGFSKEFIEKQKMLFAELKDAFAQHAISLYDQFVSLTPKRTADANLASVPCDWQRQTLDSLDGSFKSFFALRRLGDMDARPPGQRLEGSFYKIPGLSGFKFTGGKMRISFGSLDKILVTDVPEYQQKKLNNAIKLKKFEIVRDERDMVKPGRFWISVTYEIPKPPETKLLASNTVYLAIGASWIGIASPKGEFCWRMPRPDFHWKPRINAIDQRIKGVKKGSRKWKRLSSARARMFAKLAHQQKQHGQYEVVKKLLSLGVHFVVTELKVRSKQGALANAAKDERGGAPFGANWAAQNTGNIANLVAKLTEKAQEFGGTVSKLKPPVLSEEERCLPNEQRKILLARKLRE